MQTKLPTLPQFRGDIQAFANDLARQLGVNLTDIYTDLSNMQASIAASAHDIPAGGTTGQILAKTSDDDYEADWVDITDYFVMEE